jgi:hypothetical protein
MPHGLVGDVVRALGDGQTSLSAKPTTGRGSGCDPNARPALDAAHAPRAEAPPRPTDHDPDIAGVVVGPQAPPDWQREFFEEEERAKQEAEKALQQGE